MELLLEEPVSLRERRLNAHFYLPLSQRETM